MAKCAWRVCTDAAGGMACGVGQSPRGTATRGRGQRRKRDKAEGMSKKGRDERRQEAGSAPIPFSRHREPPGFDPARCSDPAGLPRLLAQARSQIHQQVPLSEMRVGAGLHAIAGASLGGWGVIARRGGKHI